MTILTSPIRADPGLGAGSAHVNHLDRSCVTTWIGVRVSKRQVNDISTIRLSVPLLMERNSQSLYTQRHTIARTHVSKHIQFSRQLGGL